MAKRKSTKKTTHRRRRRGVGGIKAGDSIMQAGYVILGVAAAGVLKKTVLANKSPMVQAIVPIVLGIGIPMMIKSDIGKFAGLGLVAVGGAGLLQKFGIGDLGNDNLMAIPMQISGDDISVIAGDEDFAMAGDDEDYAMAGDGGYGGGISVLAGVEDDQIDNGLLF